MVRFPDICDKPAAMWLCHTLFKENLFTISWPAIYTVAGELCKLARVTGPEFPHPFSPVGRCLPATGQCCAVWYKRQCLPGLCTMCWKVLVNPYPSSLHAEKCVTLPLSLFLTGQMFVRPNILRTLRRTMIRFLIEHLVRRMWFGQSRLYFILNWLVMRCKLRPELAADAQQTAWLKM